MESYKKQELLTLHKCLGSLPGFSGVCVVFLALFVLSILHVCLVYHANPRETKSSRGGLWKFFFRTQNGALCCIL